MQSLDVFESNGGTSSLKKAVAVYSDIILESTNGIRSAAAATTLCCMLRGSERVWRQADGNGVLSELRHADAMNRNRYPNLTRAQRDSGPYRRGGERSSGGTVSFPVIVVGASIAIFCAVCFGDYVPAAFRAAVLASRNLGRDHAPPAGAFYSGCNDARAAGVAPLYADEPGYRPEMDGDGDGTACEPYHGG
jgi:hypothetical protein